MSAGSEGRLERSIAMIERLVAFDTTSRNSNLALIEDVRDYLAGHGVAVRLTHDETGGKANLWATIGPEAAGGVVLSGHTDVVPVDGQKWTSDPFKVDRRDGRLYGRGTCDMKGFLATALALVPDMAKAKLTVPIHLALSYDEEVGCLGVRGIIKDVTGNLPRPRAVIVGEPTSMQLIGGNKGTRVYHSDITGVPAHSSNPALGASAIDAAARLVGFLGELGREFEADADPLSPFDPPCSTFNVGVIHGGTAHNIVAETCHVTWSVRLVPTDDADAIEARIRRFCADELDPVLKAAAPHAGVVTEMITDVPGLAPDETSAAEALVRHLTGLNASGVVAYGAEAGLFQRAGMPAVIFGPGSIDQAHKADEYVDIDQIDQCADFIGKLIDWAKTAA
ncbi:acetylornithine deacetylase [Thalassobaculum fulvum]|uniref:Acetylornithine deacetylase n=1 Tax=Thalassobaculum fulvum TaxID=1633335 RepID=A0A918XVZ5_9PROT|nr:acetylornithine deacetylase [Thalassobaculum fulvum]GHD59233.1 acetylornithine deacetylase [Thalassobaculum fulvum]